MEGDAPGEVRRRRVDEVSDLVAVDVDGEDDVAGLGHELLAEVGAYEAAGADHADGEGRDGVAVQIHAGGRRRRRRRRRRHPPQVPRRGRTGECASAAWDAGSGSEAMSVAVAVALSSRSLAALPIFKEEKIMGRGAKRIDRSLCLSFSFLQQVFC